MTRDDKLTMLEARIDKLEAAVQALQPVERPKIIVDVRHLADSPFLFSEVMLRDAIVEQSQDVSTHLHVTKDMADAISGFTYWLDGFYHSQLGRLTLLVDGSEYEPEPYAFRRLETPLQLSGLKDVSKYITKPTLFQKLKALWGGR
jgi:hypothetical protein